MFPFQAQTECGQGWNQVFPFQTQTECGQGWNQSSSHDQQKVNGQTQKVQKNKIILCYKESILLLDDLVKAVS